MALTQPQSQETALVGRIVQTNVTETSLTIKAQFEDRKTGAAREPQPGTRLFNLSKGTERFEMILADSHVTAAGVTTITVNASGRNLNKYGNMIGAATGNKHPINSEIGCADVHIPIEILNEIVRGNEGTGSRNFRVGDETDNDITIYAQNADGNKPFIQYDSAINKWIISNNGVDTYDPQAGGSGVTAGDGISLTAGDLDIDVTDTVIFVNSSSGVADSGKIPRLDANGKLVSGFITAASLATYISDVSTTATEIDQALDGISANVTAANLTTLTGGGDASALHSHSNIEQAFTAYEAVTADQAVALLPIQVEYFSQLTEVDLALGDDNARRKYAVKIYPTRTPNFTTLSFRGRENGTSTALITVTIETDNAGAPSGTAVSNGTAAALDSSSWTSTYATRTATFPGVPEMVAGTAYWIVWSTSNTDAANYVFLGVNSTYDENYITLERQTYNLGTASWGSSVTNATPFFWTVSERTSLGMAVVPTDANWGGRTWPFVGFAKANASAQASVQVYTDLVPNLSLPSGANVGAPIYLSATAGAITATPPAGYYTEGTIPSSFTYKIGRFQTHTDLKIELGRKRVVVRENTVIDATTARNYIVWFKPEIARVTASHLGSSDSTFSYGTVLADGTEAAHSASYLNGAAGGIIQNNSGSISGNAGGDGFTAAESNISNVGFTYTYTESGIAQLLAQIEIEQ